jgi:hypothetical protein
MRAMPPPAVVVATLALIAAVAGTAVAGPSANTSAAAKKTAKKALKRSKKAKSTAVEARGVAVRAQTVAEEAEGSAIEARGAATNAVSIAEAVTGRSGRAGICNPTSPVFFNNCAGATLNLAERGKVLLIATGGQLSADANSPGRGRCRLEVDDRTDLVPHDTDVFPGEVSVNTSSNAQLGLATKGFALTAVTNALPAGFHTFELACGEAVPDIRVLSPMISAVRVGE